MKMSLHRENWLNNCPARQDKSCSARHDIVCTTLYARVNLESEFLIRPYIFLFLIRFFYYLSFGIIFANSRVMDTFFTISFGQRLYRPMQSAFIYLPKIFLNGQERYCGPRFHPDLQNSGYIGHYRSERCEEE
jgi:hypothetical protein